MMILVPAFTTSILPPDRLFGGAMATSKNYANIDSVNINNVVVKYDHSMGDAFIYEVRGYFVDTSGPFAQSEASVVSIEYLNFTSSDSELLVNGSEYSNTSFDATIYDGVTAPDLMIVPVESPIVVNFKQVFVVKFELPVVIYNATGQPSVDISLKISAFNNVTDNITLVDSSYAVTYYLKTNLLINSEHFNKNNIIVEINGEQVDPYNFYVDSPMFDLKLFDMSNTLIYHDPARQWSSNVVVSFTSMKITNDYFSAVRASVAPVSIVDSLFYQTKISNYTNRNDRMIEDGSFKYIERGTLYASKDRYVPGTAMSPIDAGFIFEQQLNVYDTNITMPYSTIIDTSSTKYPSVGIVIESNKLNAVMLWVYTPDTSTDTLLTMASFDFGTLTSLATDLYFPLGIYNSTLYDIQQLFSQNSMQNATVITSFSPRSWHHIAVVYNVTNSSADVYVDYLLAYHKDNIISSSVPHALTIFAANVTTMNASSWSLAAVVKNASTSINMTFNVANIFVSSTSRASTWRRHDDSYITYVNDTYVEWCTSPPESGVYRAANMRLNGATYDDYFSWTGSTIPMFGIEKFKDGLSAGNGYDVSYPIETIETLDGHSRVLNVSQNQVEFHYTVTGTTGVTWNDPGKEAIGIDENSTTELWISRVVGSGSISVSSPTDALYIGIYPTLLSVQMNSWATSIDITVNMTDWHHIRYDICRKTGDTGPATLKFYLDGMLMITNASLTDCTFKDAYIYTGVAESMCIDAFGYWRSSWMTSPTFDNFYSPGLNMEQMWPVYEEGDYTFEDVAIGTDPNDVYPSWDKQYSGLDGNITYTDKYHRNTYEVVNTPSWTSFFVLSIPDYPQDFIKLPAGYGYDARGRVAFWFYVNSSYGASRFLFTIYDDGGTPYDIVDDTMHGFGIGNAFDDSIGNSEFIYYTENATDKVIKKSGYFLTNDTWNYLVFEWNNTGNRLDVNERTIFHGMVMTRYDTSVTIEPAYNGTGSLISQAYAYTSGSAIAWFGQGFVLSNQSDFIRDPASRTVFTMNSIPHIIYAIPAHKAGAIWKESYGVMDSLTFEYETATKHSYYPAMLTVPQSGANYTTNSMLTRIYTTSSWNDLSLYYGGFYNVTFDVNASFGSQPIQVVMDSSRYIIFPTQTVTHVSILHPIDVQSSSFRVSLWSSFGNYTIGNFKVTLTAKTPEFVDAFKKYVDENALYSKSIVSKGSAMTNITVGTYYMLATTYLAEVAFFDVITVMTSGNNFYITEPSLRQIVIEYTDQRGIHIDFNNFQTFRQVGDGYVIIPTNVFTAEIGTSVTLLSKNIFNEVIYFGSFTVTSISNYINIITVVHSLKVYNQREDFVYGVITKDYAPQFYWSEWVAPDEVIQYRLTSGSYHVTITDEMDNIISYGYNLFGDDVLIVRSVYTLESITKDINNVNATIGNQITNVAINITNQNSAINNSIVNVDISITSMNSTLGNQLLSIDATLINVNSKINEQTTYLTTLIGNINSSIAAQNIYTQSLIANVNSTINEQTVIMTTLFTNINSTILQQSANMQQYLININNTVNSMAVNLSQAFFTDLINNQTGNLTGYITSTVNSQTTQLMFEINNMTAYINNEILNVNNNIYNQTIYLNGTFNFRFSEIMSTEADIQYLIRKTEFSTLINWSSDVEVAGIIRLTMMNSYAYPMLIELRRGSNEENYTIYADNYISVYVPGGLYKYRLSNLLNNTFLPRSENETVAEAAIFKDFFVSNTSNFIETTFARIATPIVPVQTGIDPANLVVIVVFIGVIIAVFAIIWYSRYKTPSNTGLSVSGPKQKKGSESPVKSKKNGTGGKPTRSSGTGSANNSRRRGFLP